ncbi:hypothetical protein L7F22_020434 [Adiantum nelumboides]|nr:hypothetical protein [Adiantum nelumboides]
MDDNEFLSSLSPHHRRWYAELHCSRAPSLRSTPSASPSILEHSLCYESLVSMRQSAHSSKHRRSSGGGGDCYGDATANASTPLCSHRGSLSSPSALPIPKLATTSPSTLGFARLAVVPGYTPLATPLRVTPINTPHFGAQTPVETPIVCTPIKTPLDTPLGTPLPLRRHPSSHVTGKRTYCTRSTSTAASSWMTMIRR